MQGEEEEGRAARPQAPAGHNQRGRLEKLQRSKRRRVVWKKWRVKMIEVGGE
jgi:hypothetical protein